MANVHFSFDKTIRNVSWSTSAWGRLLRWLNERFGEVETAFDGMPSDEVIATMIDIHSVTPSDGVFLVGDGTDFVGESGTTARTSLGLGPTDNVTHADFTVTGTFLLDGSGDNTSYVRTSDAAPNFAATNWQNSTSGIGSSDGFQVGYGNAAFIWNYENTGLNFATNNINRLSISAAGVVTITGQTVFSTAPKPPSYTVAGVPSASALGAGSQIYVTNETGGAVPAFSDGTNWRRVTDRAVIA